MDHHRHHSWGHHHHMHMPPHFHGMGRPFGFMLLPIFALFFGLFMLMLLFKTGLWIPLLLIGAFFFFFRPMSRGGKTPEEWSTFRQNMREKMKNEWRGWNNCETPDTVVVEKPKRSDTTEFV